MTSTCLGKKELSASGWTCRRLTGHSSVHAKPKQETKNAGHHVLRPPISTVLTGHRGPQASERRPRATRQGVGMGEGEAPAPGCPLGAAGGGGDRPRHAAIWPFCVLLSLEGGCAVSHGCLVPQAVPSGH